MNYFVCQSAKWSFIPKSRKIYNSERDLRVSVLVTGNFCPMDKFSTVNVKELKNGLKLDLTIVILIINIK